MTKGFGVIATTTGFVMLLHIAIPVATNGLLSSMVPEGGRAVVALPIARRAGLAYC